MTELNQGMNDSSAVIDAVRASAPPVVVTNDAGYPLGIAHHKDLKFARLSAREIAQFTGASERHSGTTILHDPESFVRLVNREAAPGTVVYADDRNREIEAVIDETEAGETMGWRDYRFKLEARLSWQLKAWLKLKERQGQVEFAEFIEERARDVVEPAAVDLQEMALAFEAVQDGQVKAKKRLQDGSHELTFNLETEVQNVTVPKEVTLQIPLFEGGDRLQIKALIRYRIVSGQPVFFLVFTGLKDQLEEAFEALVQVMAEKLEPMLVRGEAGGALYDR